MTWDDPLPSAVVGVIGGLAIAATVFLSGCANPADNAARIAAECAVAPVAGAGVSIILPEAGVPFSIATRVACANQQPIAEGEAWANGKAKAALGR